jgi:hypothetical protein
MWVTGTILMNRFSLAILLILLVLPRLVIADRDSIEIFSYSSFTNNDPTPAVANLLRQKWELLREQTISAHPELTAKMTKIHIVARNSALPDPDQLSSYWQQTPVLEILSGGTVQTPSGNTMTTNIYLGDLKGLLKKPTVSVKLIVTAEEYQNYRDLHSVVTLYAIAMDTRKNHPTDRGITQYLADAKSLLEDLLLRDSADANDSLRDLRAAISRELFALQSSYSH